MTQGPGLMPSCTSGDREEARAGLPARGQPRGTARGPGDLLPGCWCMTHPGCSGHLTAPTPSWLGAQGDFGGQMLPVEDAPSPSRSPGYEACVLPRGQVWQGLCQAEEEQEAAKGQWERCRDARRILLPAWGQSLQPRRDLGVLAKWLGEEERVSAPHPP